MSKFGSMDERFILKRNPEHLANFTINLDKINFFEQASTLAQKMQKSEKNRKKIMKDKLQELKEKDESKRSKMQQHKKHVAQELRERRHEME